jgi:hypothetical protein
MHIGKGANCREAINGQQPSTILTRIGKVNLASSHQIVPYHQQYRPVFGKYSEIAEKPSMVSGHQQYRCVSGREQIAERPSTILTHIGKGAICREPINTVDLESDTLNHPISHQ